MTHTIAIEIPEQIAFSLKVPRAALQEQLTIELALRLYQKGILSFGKARELAKLNKWEFQEKLAKENIALNYDLEELERDLETIGEMEARV